MSTKLDMIARHPRWSLRQAVDLRKGDYFNLELICIMTWEGEVGKTTQEVSGSWVLGMGGHSSDVGDGFGVLGRIA